MTSQDDDLVAEFRSESGERLDQVEQCLLGVERGDPDAVTRAFRALHTIKGNASFVDYMAINRLAHELEHLLDAVRLGRLAGSVELVDVLLKGVDRLRRLLAAPPTGAGVPLDDLLDRVRGIAAGIAAGAPPSQVPSPAPTPTPAPQPGSGRVSRRPRLGEWLVTSGEVDAAAVVRALIAQERSGRHPLEVLLQDAGFPPDRVLALATAAEESGQHPFAALAAQDHGAWAPVRLHARIQHSRPPLGQILTDLDVVTAVRMRDLLAAYFAGEAPPPRPVPASTSAPAPTPALAETAVSPAGAATPHGAEAFPAPCQVHISDELRDELCEMTDSGARARIEEGLLALRQDAIEVADLDRLYRELHSLKGTFGFLGAGLTQRVMHAIEDAISLCKRRAQELPRGDREPLIDALLAGVDHVWRLRDACLARQDESAAGIHPALPAWKAGLDDAIRTLVAGLDAGAADHDITSEF